MTDRDKANTNDSKDHDVRRLLTLAGARTEPPDDVRERVYAKVLDEWENLPAQSDSLIKQYQRSFAVAATFALFLLSAVSGWQFFAIPEQSPIGELVFHSGSYTLDNGNEINDTIIAGSQISTGNDGRLELHFLKSTILRLDTNTQLTFQGDNRLQLLSGRIYIDSPGAQEGVHVMTPFGPVSDIGTQFLIQVDQQNLAVAVRQGAVNIQLDEQQLTANATEGQAQLVHVDKANNIKRQQIENNGEHWRWIHLASATFTLENSSVHAFVNWVSRESGLDLAFANDHVMLASKQTRLHGSIGSMTPLEAIEAILPTTRFAYRIDENNTLLIFIRGSTGTN